MRDHRTADATPSTESAPSTNRRSRRMRGGLASLAVVGLGAGLTLAAWSGDVAFTGTVTKTRTADDIISTLEARAVWMDGNTAETVSAEGGWQRFEVENGVGEIPIEQRDFTVGDEADSLLVQVRSTAANLPAEWVSFAEGHFFAGDDYFTAEPGVFSSAERDGDEPDWVVAYVGIAADSFANDLRPIDHDADLSFRVTVTPGHES